MPNYSDNQYQGPKTAAAGCLAGEAAGAPHHGRDCRDGGSMSPADYEILMRIAESDMEHTQKMANRVANAIDKYDTNATNLIPKPTTMSGVVNQEPAFFIIDKKTGTKYMVVVMEWPA